MFSSGARIRKNQYPKKPQHHCVNLTLLFSLQGTNVVTFTVYWVFSALYLFVDLTERPKWALQYKIQDGSNQPVSFISSHYCLYCT